MYSERYAMRSILIASLLFATHLVGAEETIILHPSVAVSHIDPQTVKDIFLGRRTTWDDGSKIILVVAENGPGQEALMQLLGRNRAQFLISWKKLMFSGKGSVPLTFGDEASVVSFVARTPGAISYVESGKVADGVKAVPTR